MKAMDALFTLLIIGGFAYLVVKELGKDNKKDDINILCIPSGEVIKISSYKFDRLKEHGYTEWDREYKCYCINDKIKKTL